MILLRMNPRLSAVPRDSDRRGSKSHLAVNSGIHVQERRDSRNAMEKQVSRRTGSVLSTKDDIY